jgi:uncharacterized Zn-binding protein involved in type VI secretion
MPKAARLGDPIGHSPSMSWLVKGLLIGAAVALAGVAIVGTGGLAAVAVVGGVAAGGAGIGEALSTMSWAPKEVSGAIIGPCSPNVFVNMIPLAARAHLDFVACSIHPAPPPPIAQGSSNVFINRMPAARVDDKTACGGSITDGSPNVFIGGGTVQTDVIHPENLVPDWVHAALLVVGVASAAVLAGPAAAILGLVRAVGGGWLGRVVGGAVWGPGSDGQKWAMLAGSLLGGILGSQSGEWIGENPEVVPMDSLPPESLPPEPPPPEPPPPEPPPEPPQEPPPPEPAIGEPGAAAQPAKAPPDLENLSPKIIKSMAKRNWTKEEMAETVRLGTQEPAVDFTAGNAPATRYTNPATGRALTANNATGKIIQVGDVGFTYDTYNPKP